MALIPFVPNSTFSVAGMTGSGKTQWVYRLLKNLNQMFEDAPPLKVMYCYGVYQDLYREMEETLSDIIIFHQGLPSQEEIEQFTPDNNHRIIILDDLMSEVTESKTMQDLFCQFCHHRKITVIFITQNVFVQGKHARNIALNTHYFILLKNMRNHSQIKFLGQQLFPHKSKLLSEAYEDAMKEPYAYLVVDTSPHSTDQFRVRTHIFPGEYPIVYDL